MGKDNMGADEEGPVDTLVEVGGTSGDTGRVVRRLERLVSRCLHGRRKHLIRATDDGCRSGQIVVVDGGRLRSYGAARMGGMDGLSCC